jgi:hypothetical protein
MSFRSDQLISPSGQGSNNEAMLPSLPLRGALVKWASQEILAAGSLGHVSTLFVNEYPSKQAFETAVTWMKKLIKKELVAAMLTPEQTQVYHQKGQNKVKRKINAKALRLVDKLRFSVYQTLEKGDDDDDDDGNDGNDDDDNDDDDNDDDDDDNDDDGNGGGNGGGNNDSDDDEDITDEAAGDPGGDDDSDDPEYNPNKPEGTGTGRRGKSRFGRRGRGKKNLQQAMANMKKTIDGAFLC